MSVPIRISRRRFLTSVTAIFGGVGAVAARPWTSLIVVSRGSLARRVVGLLDHGESARAVGRAFLATAATGASASELVDQIASRVARDRSTLEDANDGELRGLLVTAVRTDFERLRVVDVDGWILSSTEARVYALAAVIGDADDPTMATRR